jgi:uncharacterized repeat protein (TIGR03803 family)
LCAEGFTVPPIERTVAIPRLFALVALSFLLPANPAAAQIVTVLHSFSGGPTDGQLPNAYLTVSGSTLYGTTLTGGAAASGTVFKVGTNGTGFSLLHSFTSGLNDGDTPNGGLTLSGSTLYGMTQGGGSAGNTGTVFRLNADGTGFGLLHRFTGTATDGRGPLGSLALSGPALLGMTPQGGTANLGTVFQLNADGTGFGLVHSFTASPADGRFPTFGALTASGTTLYGMTNEGGTANQGAVFRMNADGTGFSLLHSFVPATGDGWAPDGSLTLVGSTLYGMTRQGGGGAGTIFEMDADGTGYRILHTFAGTSGGDGANPVGTLTLVGSKLYGTTPTGGTNALGVLFDINLDGTGYQVLHSFAGGPFEPANPGDVVLSGSALYGISGAGGASNLGTVFSFPVVVPEPSALLLTAAGGGVAVLAKRRRKERARTTTGGRG